MPRHLCLQDCNQARIHEPVVVGDIETDQPLAFELRAIFLLDLCPVGPFHDEEDVGPFDQFG